MLLSTRQKAQLLNLSQLSYEERNLETTKTIIERNEANDQVSTNDKQSSQPQ